VIYLSQDLKDKSRRNLTLAHEIGHIVLKHNLQAGSAGVPPCALGEVVGDLHDTPEVKSTARALSVLSTMIVNTDPAEDDLEIEARAFAAELLMPERSVRERFLSIFRQVPLSTESPVVHQIMRVPGSPKWRAAFALSVHKPRRGLSMAASFGVPPKDMARRLQVLRLIID